MQATPPFSDERYAEVVSRETLIILVAESMKSLLTRLRRDSETTSAESEDRQNSPTVFLVLALTLAVLFVLLHNDRTGMEVPQGKIETRSDHSIVGDITGEGHRISKVLTCTPEVLTSNAGNNNSSKTNEDGSCIDDDERGCWAPNRSGNGIFYWKVSRQVQDDCHLATPQIVPLQSTPRDIQGILTGKWILMIGDSSTRMLHDYLVGRWLGNYSHWPEQWDNHGPASHSHLCAMNSSCHYDVFHKGARVTFVWLSQDFNTELNSLLHQNVGVPDMVVGQHGYWEQSMPTAEEAKAHSEGIVRNITNCMKHEEMKSEYPSAYDTPLRFSTEHNHINATTASHGPSMTRPFKIWMSAFDRNFFTKLDANAANSAKYDGSRLAKRLGWHVLDRSYFGRDPRTHAPQGPIPRTKCWNSSWKSCC